jgi:predicted nuclease with RNAse H fold
MRTLGIDLAAQPKETAACWVTWTNEFASVGRIAETALDNDTLLELCVEADRVGIDSPFGWPNPFADALNSWRADSSWPTEDREPLRFRETDLYVRDTVGQTPLSVSTDRIGVTAMRCVRLLNRATQELGLDGGALDRIGGRIVEVYPAAALRSWGFDCRGYKGSKPENRERRSALVTELCSAEWIDAGPKLRGAWEASDHELDAFIAALVARAASVELTALPSRKQESAAMQEGWIHVPASDSWDQLARAEKLGV